MYCPNCHHSDTRVIDSRPEREGRSIRRRRECEKCQFRFNTAERVTGGNLQVVKNDGRKEQFDFDKLHQSIAIACGKRPISRQQISDIVREVYESMFSKHEVSSKVIGEKVMTLLKELDQIAYIRFASVYRRFKDVEDFKEEVSKLF